MIGKSMSWRFHRWKTLGLVLALVWGGSPVPWGRDAGPFRPLFPLSLEDRVACERVLQGLDWQARIWPKANPQPKPPLEAVLPEAVSRQKVEDLLRKEAALEALWGVRITEANIRAELERMARSSKAPERLRAMWAALGNDGYVAGECLARPILVERFLRSQYAYDARIHGSQRRAIEEELARYGGRLSMGYLRGFSGRYQEAEWVRKAGRGEDREGRPLERALGDRVVLELEEGEWTEAVGRLAGWFGDALPSRPTAPAGGWPQADRLPVGSVSPLREEADRFLVAAVLEATADRLVVATVEWAKKGLEAWWSEVRWAYSPKVHGEVYRLDLPVVTAVASCEGDTWAATGMPSLPSARAWHTAVWTGTEMVVWGGVDGTTYFNTGGRYDPATDTWAATSTVNAPSARAYHTAVWTGAEMIVWGGVDGTTFFNTGGRYDPATDTWAATSTVNAPSARAYHTAVWTGTGMIVWGGTDGTTFFNTGGVYLLEVERWALTNPYNAPLGRYRHTAVWTGKEMVVWGGTNGLLYFNTGGRYDLATNTWRPTSTVNVPSGRDRHTAVWTGTEMIVWGGRDSLSYFNTGGRYDPAADTWTATSTANAPLGRFLHRAVWTGTEMIVWGGSPTTDTGGRYDPAADTWRPTSMAGAPSARSEHTAVWTGTEMIVWGGSPTTDTGGRYDPAADTWTATSTANVPSGRDRHTAVWTGTEMVVWGGWNGLSYFNTGGRYDPATDTWTATRTANAPLGRYRHTAVWTGTEMVVWGGRDGTTFFDTGGRYDPATDTWAATRTANAPSGRYWHTAVWTGTEMIVWGGVDGTTFFNTGGRYDPVMDKWAATSTAGAPRGRDAHTAVWTGTEMIVWGGFPTTDTGGRYDPAADTWRPTSMVGAPSARSEHTAVWTGTAMVVWGGWNGQDLLNTGGRYDPAADTWRPTSMAGAPSARSEHTAVWTGTAMVVWGGWNGLSYFNTGGRYNPATDTWAATSTANAPSGRFLHRAVWTGTAMVVWGGRDGATYFNTGGRYCALPLVSPTGLTIQDPNGNGVWDSGESIVVVPAWRNNSAAAFVATGNASNVVAPPGVWAGLTDTTANYGVIPAGETADCQTATWDCYGIGGTRTSWGHGDVTLDEAISVWAKTWTLHIGPSFADVATNAFYYKPVETLLHWGITGGCTTTDYCPLQTVTRSQMAIFISKAVLGGNPPASGSGPGGSWDCMDNAPNQFTDVPDGVFYCPHAHWMWANNVTAGCTATTYCPNDPVNRAQMAIFISRAVLGGNPPASGSGPGGSWDCMDNAPNQFTDVPDTVFYCLHAHWMWANNVTAGCTATTYCPGDPTNRAQMATFTVRAFNLLLYGP